MKKIVLHMLIIVLFLCSCSKKTVSGEKINLNQNQSMVIGRITEITGNDMTVSLLQEKDRDEAQKMPERKGHQPMPTGDEKPPEMAEGKGDQPMPTGDAKPPEITERKGDASMSEKENQRADMAEDSDKNKNENKTMYIETGESASYSIPVGTTVTTILGAKTTFSSLAQGDTVKIVLEKGDSGNDIVVGIWIVE